MTELTKKPITSTTTKITTGAAALLAILAIVMGSGLIGQENVYVCADLQIAQQCDKLSSMNDEGIQSRCYYFSDEKARDTYKTCKSGWEKYVPPKEESISEDKEYETISNDTTICKLVKGDEMIKECITSDNETYLYMFRF